MNGTGLSQNNGGDLLLLTIKTISGTHNIYIYIPLKSSSQTVVPYRIITFQYVNNLFSLHSPTQNKVYFLSNVGLNFPVDFSLEQLDIRKTMCLAR